MSPDLAPMRRKQALALGLKEYTSPFRCLKCHSYLRRTRSNACVGCQQIQRRKRELLIQRGRQEVMDKARTQILREMAAAERRQAKEAEKAQKGAARREAKEAAARERRRAQREASRAEKLRRAAEATPEPVPMVSPLPHTQEVPGGPEVPPWEVVTAPAKEGCSVEQAPAAGAEPVDLDDLCPWD